LPESEDSHASPLEETPDGRLRFCEEAFEEGWNLQSGLDTGGTGNTILFGFRLI
jgi:hypothetical protein